MILGEILSIVAKCQYLNWDFRVTPKESGFLLQAKFIDGGETQYTRKWYIGSYASESEVVRTVFKCIITAMEYEIRKKFLYKGKNIMCSDFNVEKLLELNNIVADENNQPEEILPVMDLE